VVVWCLRGVPWYVVVCGVILCCVTLSCGGLCCIMVCYVGYVVRCWSVLIWVHGDTVGGGVLYCVVWWYSMGYSCVSACGVLYHVVVL